MPDPIQVAPPAPAPLAEGAAARSNLDRSLIVGVAWTAGVKWGTQILSWACTLIIARLLSPADYGLFGMAMVIQGFIGNIYDFGLEDTIVRQRTLTDDQIARLGGLGLLYGVTFALITIAIAEPVAQFYREPAVEWILKVLALTTIIEAVQMLPRALLARELRFRTLAWIDGAAGLSLGVGTLLFAFAGLRYQALAYSAVTSGTIGAIVALSVARHRLALPRRHAGLRSPIKFGLQIVLARIAWYVYTHADFAVISRMLGKAALGAYTFAWALATLPADRFAALVGNVMRGVFSAVQDDKAALRRYWLATTEGLSFVVLPIAAGLAIAADDVILVVLGDQWRGAITPLRFLAAYGGFRALIAMLPPLLIAAGHPRRNLERTLLGVAVLPALFYFGSRWGTTGVAIAWIVGYPLVSLPAYRFTFRLVGLTPGLYLRAIWPAASATLVMAAVVFAAHTAMRDWPLFARFALETAAGAATYVALVLTQHRDRIAAFRSLLNRARETGPAADPE